MEEEEQLRGGAALHSDSPREDDESAGRHHSTARPHTPPSTLDDPDASPLEAALAAAQAATFVEEDTTCSLPPTAAAVAIAMRQSPPSPTPSEGHMVAGGWEPPSRLRTSASDEDNYDGGGAGEGPLSPWDEGEEDIEGPEAAAAKSAARATHLITDLNGLGGCLSLSYHAAQCKMQVWGDNSGLHPPKNRVHGGREGSSSMRPRP